MEPDELSAMLAKMHKSRENEANAVENRVVACLFGEDADEVGREMLASYVSSTFMELAKYIWRITEDNDPAQAQALKLLGEARKLTVVAAYRRMKDCKMRYPPISVAKQLRTVGDDG